MVGERIAAMDCFMRSASEGPPKRAARTSVLTDRVGAGFSVVVVVEGEEFSMDHLRRLDICGSIVGIEGVLTVEFVVSRA